MAFKFVISRYRGLHFSSIFFFFFGCGCCSFPRTEATSCRLNESIYSKLKQARFTSASSCSALHIFLCNFRMTCVSIWLSGSRFRNIFMALSRFEEAAAKLLSQRTQIFQRSAYFFALSLPLSLPCRRHFSHPLDFRRDCF